MIVQTNLISSRKGSAHVTVQSTRIGATISGHDISKNHLRSKQTHGASGNGFKTNVREPMKVVKHPKSVISKMYMFLLA